MSGDPLCLHVLLVLDRQIRSGQMRLQLKALLGELLILTRLHPWLKLKDMLREGGKYWKSGNLKRQAPESCNGTMKDLPKTPAHQLLLLHPLVGTRVGRIVIMNRLLEEAPVAVVIHNLHHAFLLLNALLVLLVLRVSPVLILGLRGKGERIRSATRCRRNTNMKTATPSAQDAMKILMISGIHES